MLAVIQTLGRALIAAQSRAWSLMSGQALVADHVDRYTVGTDNSKALQDALDALTDIGGGTVQLPPGKLYFTKGVVVRSKGVFIKGAGKYSTICVFNPSTPQSFITFDTGSGSLYCAGASDFSIEGISAVTGGASGCQVNGIESICTSQFTLRNIRVYGLWTDSSLIGTQGPSRGVYYRGKELMVMENCMIAADLPIDFQANPYEREGLIIDSDGIHITDLYSAAGPAYPNINIGPNLNFISFLMDGKNNMTSGLHGIYCQDVVGGLQFDWSQISINHLRFEQSSPGGWTIHLVRPGGGKIFGLQLKDIACAFGTNRSGVKLRGIIQATHDNVNYTLFSGQDTAGMMYDLYSDAYCRHTFVNCFYPFVGGPSLVNFNGMTVVIQDDDRTGSWNALATRFMVKNTTG